MSNDRKMRMDAYYFGFNPTGEEAVDRVLSAVASAGKAFHYTGGWTEVNPEYPPGDSYSPGLRGASCQEWIQNAAVDAAAAFALAREEGRRQGLEEAAQVIESEFAFHPYAGTTGAAIIRALAAPKGAA